MSDQRRESATPVEPYFDRTPQPFGDGLPDPLVYDASPRMLRQRTVNFAAKRLADMRYVSGLDRTSVGGRRCRRAGSGSAPHPTARQNSSPPSGVVTSSST